MFCNILGAPLTSILYSSSAGIRLLAFFDANWVGDLDEKYSTLGYLFSLGCGLVFWCFEKQQGVGLVIVQVVGWENPDPTTKQVLQLGNPTPNVTSM
jgi:hypothetical protein